jgi:hypothetical protein
MWVRERDGECLLWETVCVYMHMCMCGKGLDRSCGSGCGHVILQQASSTAIREARALQTTLAQERINREKVRLSATLAFPSIFLSLFISLSLSLVHIYASTILYAYLSCACALFAVDGRDNKQNVYSQPDDHEAADPERPTAQYACMWSEKERESPHVYV